MKFSEMLKDARQQFNFSQKFVADRLGLKPPTISKYENGIAFPSPRVLRGLCDLFRWDAARTFQMVYKEKAPEMAKPFLTNFDFPHEDKSTPRSGGAETDGHSALLEFLQDPRMPRPTETELEVLMAVRLRGGEPTKWFYKSLLDDLRNEGLIIRKSAADEDLKLQEST